VLFGGISGSAAADATAIGGLMIPQMKEKGYSVEYGVNVTVISSIIALMLPPSHNMIIYSISAGGRLSIADLFTAGIIPGLLARGIADDHRLVRRQESRLSDRDPFPAGPCWARSSSTPFRASC
jgi:TRAP-type mannitol/chloroaromatic compound transport system permease large subunit